MSTETFTCDDGSVITRDGDDVTIAKAVHPLMWVPKHGEVYYFCRTDGTTIGMEQIDCLADLEKYKAGNLYRTSDDAEVAAEKQRETIRLRRRVLELNECCGRTSIGSWFPILSGKTVVENAVVRSLYPTVIGELGSQQALRQLIHEEDAALRLVHGWPAKESQ